MKKEESAKLIKRTKEEKLRKDDIVIAIMGPTGAGKSNIIDHIISQTEKRSGAGLESCTSEISVVRIKHHGRYGDRVVLVDTPGFGDTNKTDMEILQSISKWLVNIYKSNVFLHSAVFLHRITDNRMGESHCRSLHAFLGICGTEVASNVAFVTTMWDDLEVHSQGIEREEHLTNNYWAPMVRHGAHTYRFFNTRESAIRILNDLLENKGNRAPFRIQEEMVDRRRPLRETQAAKALYLPMSLIRKPTTPPTLSLSSTHSQRKESYDEWERVNLEVDYRDLGSQTRIGASTAGKQRSGLKTKALQLTNIFTRNTTPRKVIEDTLFSQAKRDSLLQEHRTTTKVIEDLLQRAGGIKRISHQKKSKEEDAEGSGTNPLLIESVTFVKVDQKVRARVTYGPFLREVRTVNSVLFNDKMSNDLRAWFEKHNTVSIIGTLLDLMPRFRAAQRSSQRITYITLCQRIGGVRRKTNIKKRRISPAPSSSPRPGLCACFPQPFHVANSLELVPNVISSAYDIQTAKLAFRHLLKSGCILLIISIPLDAIDRYRVAGTLLNNSLASLTFRKVLKDFLISVKDNLNEISVIQLSTIGKYSLSGLDLLWLPNYLLSTGSIDTESYLHGSVPRLCQVPISFDSAPTVVSNAFNDQIANVARYRLLKDQCFSVVMLIPYDSIRRYRVAGVLLNQRLASLGLSIVIGNFLPRSRDNPGQVFLIDDKLVAESNQCSNELKSSSSTVQAVNTKSTSEKTADQRYSSDLTKIATYFWGFLGYGSKA